MATKVKPSRLQVTWTPQAWQVPLYVDEDCFQWWSGGGEWWCITGTLCNQTDLQWALNCKLDASALSNTNYWWAWNGDTTHTPTKNAIYTKLHTMDVEIWNKAADNTVVKLSWNQVIAWTKTFCTSPVVPEKCAAAVNCGTAIATEAQVYNVATSAELKCNMVCNLSGADNDHYPSAKAVADALSCAWAGDMLASVYDPCNKCSNAFDYCNFINTPTIPTDNCQLANGCDYATCCYVNDSINSVTAYYITKNAQGDQWACYAELASASTYYSWWVQRTPTRNDYTIVLDDECYCCATTRYIYNSGWEYQYTVNETPLTQSQLDALNSGITAAKVCCYDAIPVITDNCQIANWCGYTTCTWTLVASDLNGYAKTCSLCTVATSGKYCDLTWKPTIPTDNCQLANWCWYTTCTGTLVAWDLACYACCCDIPTDNCQLSNGCWYTTCTWTISNCAGIISALWYTPYNSSNPSGYTTCTWTLTASNICDAALSSSWDWVTTKAPSMNAVYDAIWDIETLLAAL